MADQLDESSDTQAVLHDVLAFIDSCNGQSTGKTKKPRAKDAPDYERKRRERKKAEREALRRQVAQYEAQLELLKLQHPSRSEEVSESKWRWLDEELDEEQKLQQTQAVNRQLRGCVIEQLHATQAFRSLIDHETTLAKRVQTIVSRDVLNLQVHQLTPTHFNSHETISAHLKGVLRRHYPSVDYVFGSNPLLGSEVMETLTSSATIKHQDPIAGPCIELTSTAPLGLKFKPTVQLMWDMMLGREVFGPDSGPYIIKAKQLTQQSAEMKYSMDFGNGSTEGALMLDGVTLMEKYEEENRAVLVWTSLLTMLDGKPCFTSQGCVAIKKLPSNPEEESAVHMCNRLSGSHFGISSGSTTFDMQQARKHQRMAKHRLDAVQKRILDRVEQLHI